MKILILGGYGVFGGRLARLLRDVPDLTLLICGRDQAKAAAFCDRYSRAARMEAAALDRSRIADGLLQLRPDLVVDASGPFQDYGTDRYRVVEACIAAGIDYLDFADGAEFVSGVVRHDAAARRAGVFVLSGVSSFPVLTAAVLRELARTMELTAVAGGIAPSPYAGIGLNVMRAVVGYAGSQVPLLRDGKPGFGVGLGETMRYTIAVPGRLPLRNLRFSLVDVPDLQVIPPEHPTLRDIWMGAGPVPEALHRILNLLARTRYRLRLPSLEPFSRLFYLILNMLKFGEHRGGMFVHAQGMRDGAPVERSWHLLAEGDDGPFIPSMAIEGIIRKLLAGERPQPGARPATHALELVDYDRLFAGRSIHTGFREDGAGQPLYRRVLDAAFDELPARVRELHDSMAKRRWEGVATVSRERGLLARIVAAVIGFPASGDGVPVTVGFEPENSRERWTRTFAGRSFHSHQSFGTGRNAHLLVERFGLVSVALALVVNGDRLMLVPRRWSLLGMPLPRSLLPGGASFETEIDGRFHFDVEIRVPIIGKIVAYQGWLAPTDIA